MASAPAIVLLGYSNIQGQRPVGHGHKRALVPLDKLAQRYRFEPPREQGYDTAEARGAIINGRVNRFIGLGGNFVRAAPDTVALEAAWRRLRLTVQVGTKLNRSQLIHGEMQSPLPCLGRIETSGPQ
jgi:anaerobic selenocysteine-containing dehydrogenase